jgi:hypothetical protein
MRIFIKEFDRCWNDNGLKRIQHALLPRSMAEFFSALQCSQQGYQDNLQEIIMASFEDYDGTFVSRDREIGGAVDSRC